MNAAVPLEDLPDDLRPRNAVPDDDLPDELRAPTARAAVPASFARTASPTAAVAEPAPEPDPDENTFGAAFTDRARELLVDPVVRGWHQTMQATNPITEQFGEDTTSAAQDIAVREAAMRAIPKPDYVEQAETAAREESRLARIEGITQKPAAQVRAEGPGSQGLAPSLAAGLEYLKNPRAGLNVGLESFTGSLASMFGGAAGGAAGGTMTAGPLGTVVGAALGAGAGSFLTEYGSDILDTMRENHVDLADAEAVSWALTDPDLMSQARMHALKRGASVGAFDALSAGIAGRLKAPIERTLASAFRRPVRGAAALGEAAEVATQGALGGMGEAAGSIATGEAPDPVAIAQEFIGELPSGGTEIATQRYLDAHHEAEEEAKRAAADAITEARIVSAYHNPTAHGAPIGNASDLVAGYDDEVAATRADEANQRVATQQAANQTAEQRAAAAGERVSARGQAEAQAQAALEAQQERQRQSGEEHVAAAEAAGLTPFTPAALEVAPIEGADGVAEDRNAAEYVAAAQQAGLDPRSPQALKQFGELLVPPSEADTRAAERAKAASERVKRRQATATAEERAAGTEQRMATRREGQAAETQVEGEAEASKQARIDEAQDRAVKHIEAAENAGLSAFSPEALQRFPLEKPKPVGKAKSPATIAPPASTGSPVHSEASAGSAPAALPGVSAGEPVAKPASSPPTKKSPVKAAARSAGATKSEVPPAGTSPPVSTPAPAPHAEPVSTGEAAPAGGTTVDFDHTDGRQVQAVYNAARDSPQWQKGDYARLQKGDPTLIQQPHIQAAIREAGVAKDKPAPKAPRPAAPVKQTPVSEPDTTDEEDTSDEPTDDEAMVGQDDDIGEQAAGDGEEITSAKDSAGGPTSAQRRTPPPPKAPTPAARTGATTPTTTDPIQRIAQRKADELRKQREAADSEPDIAPKRDTQLGRSTFDTMWRDLFGAPGTSAERPANDTKESLIRNIQNAPMKRQMELAKQRLTHFFGFADIKISGLSPREAMDVLLDAYNNLYTMANVTGFPRQAMGFGGRITLNLTGKIDGNKHIRGSFDWEKMELSLARRADSFTHEWLHALDFDLLTRFLGKNKRTPLLTMLSDYTRNPLSELPEPIAKAFTAVMQSIYLTDEASAQRVANLSLIAAVTQHQLKEAKGRKDTDTAQRMQDILTKTQAEMADILKKNATQFHQGAAYADALQGRQYFALPFELFARAGESWMGNRIGQQAGTEFLSGDPAYYNQNSDALMALIYPNEIDRHAIFDKFDQLFKALAEGAYYEGDMVEAKIPGTTAFDKELTAHALASPQINLFRQVYEDSKKDVVNLAMAIREILRPGTIAKILAARKEAAEAWRRSDAVNAFRSTDKIARALIASYKDKPEVQKLLRKFFFKLTTDPGTRQVRGGFAAQNYIDRLKNADQKRIDHIVSTFNIDPKNAEQMKALHEAFARPTEQVRLALEEHKSWLEERREAIKGDRNKTKEIADIHDQLARIDAALAQRPLPENTTDNVEKAALALRKLADRIYYDNKKAGVNMGYVSNYMRRTLTPEAIRNNRPRFLEKATLAYQDTNEENIQKLQRQIGDKLDEKKKWTAAAKRTGTQSPLIARLDKEIADAREQIAEIRKLDPALQAEEYLASLTIPDIYLPTSNTASSKYTKSRVLGPAADLHLAEFYDQNVLRSMYNMVATSAYHTTYAKMFGANSEQLKIDRLDMVTAGLDERDLPAIDDAVKVAFGQTGNYSSAADAVVNWMMLLGQMKMLVKSFTMNVFEPFTAGARTGSVYDGMKALAHAYIPLLNRASQKESQYVMELAGLVASTTHETVFANRAGSGAENTLLRKMYTGFGKLSKLEGLTRRGRYGVYRVMTSYTRFLSQQMLESKNADERREAHDEFNEIGIPPDQHEAFAKFMMTLPKGLISVDMMNTPGNEDMKKLYGGAMYELIRQSIQDPQRTERARGSFHPVGRFVFSITNFIMSFGENVIRRQYQLVKTAQGWDRKAVYAFRSFRTMSTLVGLAMIANMAREWWDDPDRFKKKKVEDFTSWLAIVSAMDRAGLDGRLSPFVNIILKCKYDREISSLAMGAVPSFYIDSVAKMIKGWLPGSSTYDERQAYAALFDMTVGMAAAPAMIGADATGPLGWLAATKLNSRGWRQGFAEWAVPETTSERKSAAGKVKAAAKSPAELARDEQLRQRTKARDELRYGS